MKAKYFVAVMIAASVLMIPGLSVQAADRNDPPADQTMGEKIDDAAITSKVKMQLMRNRATSAMHTEVETNSGIVTLAGKAGSRAEKELATELAKNVKGVIRVNNLMVIDTSK
ncbi:MAG TPA: BON domain-containing protein [Desulfuromonadaceae bacterium]|jgi:osmotically-inducible protein OsmY